MDRLALLLQDSKFSCTQKKPGYYADDGLRCEVFHYCNEGVRHSWMCPAGTLFHQIHLICMAEGGDNICKQSTKFHFVNDYLYKPLQESTQESNGTIRYANRYFPNEAGQVQDPSGGGQQLQQGGGLRQPIQDDFSDFQAPPQGQSFRPRPQSEESFFAPPPPRSSGGGARFRPTFEDDGAQFVEPPAEFSGGSRGGGSRSSHLSGEDLRAFGSDEAPSTRFQSQAPSRVRGRQGGRSQDFPVFSRS